jgi:four helix bundle protein
MHKPHKKLEVWKQSMDLVIKLYKITEEFLKEEKYLLTNQIKRSAISIPSSMAEGAGRNTKKEFINFLHIAQGSLSELDTQLEIAQRLDYLNYNAYYTLDELMTNIDKMLTGLIKSQKK